MSGPNGDEPLGPQDRTEDEPAEIFNNSGQVIYNSGPGYVYAPVYPAEISWPVSIGTVPALADHFQPRAEMQQLLTRADSATSSASFNRDTMPRSLVTRVLSGLGGNGKTQLAAWRARALWDSKKLDLRCWIVASSRDRMVSGYAAAAQNLSLPSDYANIEQSAEAFLAWLAGTAKSWLVVLDDVANPADLSGLWPEGSQGEVIVTTRRHDANLGSHSRQIVDVGLYSPAEALSYLSAKLPASALDEAAELAEDLGLLPLALAQATSVMRERGESCAAYRRRFTDLRRKLLELMPPEATADDYAIGPHARQRLTIATTWQISIDAADQLQPHGLASQMLSVAALLDPNGIPIAVLTAVVLPNSSDASPTAATPEWDEDDRRTAVGNLARVSLAIVDAPPVQMSTLRVHGLVQRAVRDTFKRPFADALARAAADALLRVWPDADYGPGHAAIAANLRANAYSIFTLNADALWASAQHGLLLRLGRSLFEAGQPDAAVSYHADLAERTRMKFGDGDERTLAARNNLASVLEEAGSLDEAVAIFEANLLARERVLGAEAPATLTSRGNLARAYRRVGRFAEAIPLLEATLRAHQRVLGADNPVTHTSRSSLADAYLAVGRSSDALPLLRAALEGRARLLGPDDPATLRSMNNLALAHLQLGETKHALVLFETALRANERVLGLEHPETLTTRSGLASAYQEVGRLTDAIPLFKATAEASTRVLGAEHPSTLTYLNSLGYCYLVSRRLADALPILRATLLARVRVLGMDHPNSVNSCANLARAYREAGRLPDALPLYKLILEVQERTLGADHPQTIISSSVLAFAYRDAGRLTRAVPLFEAAYTAAKRVLGPNDPNTITSQANLAFAYQHTGRVREAVRLFEEVLHINERRLGPEHLETRASRQNLQSALRGV